MRSDTPRLQLNSSQMLRQHHPALSIDPGVALPAHHNVGLHSARVARSLPLHLQLQPRRSLGSFTVAATSSQRGFAAAELGKSDLSYSSGVHLDPLFINFLLEITPASFNQLSRKPETKQLKGFGYCFGSLYCLSIKVFVLWSSSVL